MTWPIPPGWYPDPSGAPGARYWNGLAWTVHRAPPALRVRAAATPRTLSSASRRMSDLIAAHPGITVAAVIYLGIGLAFAMDGYWAAMKGWALLAALVGGPAGLVLLAVRRTKRRREARERCRQHDARLAARAEREHQALLRGDLDVGVFRGIPSRAAEPAGSVTFAPHSVAARVIGPATSRAAEQPGSVAHRHPVADTTIPKSRGKLHSPGCLLS